MSDLLLLSNSVMSGRTYLEHALEDIGEFLGDDRTVHFAPYAMSDFEDYSAQAQQALRPLGVSIVGLHKVEDVCGEVGSARVLFVGGGNTFRLLKRLQDLGLLEPVRRRVEAGALRYLGASAGTNMA